MAKLTAETTFRCHIMVRGTQCPCDLTMVNTFTYTLATLDEKARRAGEKKASAKTLKANALCPWHAKFLLKTRRDVVRMADTLSVFERRESRDRRREAAQAAREKDNQAFRKRFLARQPALGAALMQAGVSAS